MIFEFIFLRIGKLYLNIVYTSNFYKTLNGTGAVLRRVETQAPNMDKLNLPDEEKIEQNMVTKSIERAQAQDIKGIKVQIAGRLNGAEIARTEWVKEGRMPLQTLRADIDYVSKEAKTIYGILGIKVWLFKSEILIK